MWEKIGNISDVVTCLGLVVSIIIYWLEKRNNLKLELSHEISELLDFYYTNLKNVTDKECYNSRVQYMSKLDMLSGKAIQCPGMTHFVKKQTGEFFLRQYDEFIEEYIKQRREQFGRDNYYKNIEDMIRKM